MGELIDESDTERAGRVMTALLDMVKMGKKSALRAAYEGKAPVAH